MTQNHLSRIKNPSLPLLCSLDYISLRIPWVLRNQGVQGTDEELQTAVLHCAGHAFSLTLLASLMRDHHMNLETLFKNAALWTGDIASNLLDQIYTLQLTEVQRQLLLAFSAYREPILLDAALAIIANVSRRQVSSALKTLLTQHLLEAIGDGRYQLHAIIATYAQDHFNEGSEQANRQALQAAHASAAHYYLQLASTTCPPRNQRRKISEVHPLIEAVWQYCQAEYWQEAYDLMEQEGIFSDLRRWGGNAVLLELNKLLLPVDKWHPKPSQAARIYEYLGRIYRTLGQFEQSHKHLEQLLSVSREAEERGEEGSALYYLGRNYFEQGYKKEALEYFEQALHISREVGDRIGEGKIVTVLGRLYNELGRREQARESIKQALDIFRKVGDSEDEITALNSLGSVYSDLGQKEQSLNYYEQALDICREIGDLGAEGWTLNNLGKVYAYMGQKKPRMANSS
jgi:tetratricopeptide (TPR) repeat protein